jgi:hypothetical protein
VWYFTTAFSGSIEKKTHKQKYLFFASSLDWRQLVVV